mmetsp:Transcript_8575/g.12793  ORF Transcript_8575/g.12793 Transcript_8575/m.12793 type:complete len:221 (+) Transcript_8575:24-686(+)
MLYGEEVGTVHKGVALGLHLVGPHQQLQVVPAQEGLGVVRSKSKSDASLARSLALLFLRVSPEQVRHEARLRRLSVSSQRLDVCQGHLFLRAQATVHHEDLVLDNGGQRQQVEQLGELLHHRGIILMHHFPLEAVDAVHVLGLVVASQQVEALRLGQPQRDQRHGSLEGERAAIHEISIEQVVAGVRRHSAQVEYVAEVVELAVGVSTDRERRVVFSSGR